MNEGTQLTFDALKTLLRYFVIAYCFKIGVTDSELLEVYVGLATAGVTVLWGLYDSYWARAAEYFKGK